MSRTRTVGALLVGVSFLFTVGCRETPSDAPVARAEGASCPIPAPPPAQAPVLAPAAATPAPPAAALASPSANPNPSAAIAKAAEGSLSVKRLVVAPRVRDHEPVESDHPFKVGSKRVYAFVEVENHGHATSEIRVEFQPPDGGPAHGDVNLAVGDGARWRTWAYTRAVKTPGVWHVVVKSTKGEVLARTSFNVEA